MAPRPDHDDGDDDQAESRRPDRRGCGPACPAPRLPARDDGDQRADGIADAGSQVPGDGVVASAGMARIWGVRTWRASRHRPGDTEPSSSIERRRQRDDRQAQGLEHESLLRPIGDHEPVEGDIEDGQDREQPRSIARTRRLRISECPGAGHRGEPDRGQPGVENREQDIAQAPPVSDRHVIRTGAHRLRAVPARARACGPTLGLPGDRAGCR